MVLRVVLSIRGMGLSWNMPHLRRVGSGQSHDQALGGASAEEGQAHRATWQVVAIQSRFSTSTMIERISLKTSVHSCPGPRFHRYPNISQHIRTYHSMPTYPNNPNPYPVVPLSWQASSVAQRGLTSAGVCAPGFGTSSWFSFQTRPGFWWNIEKRDSG